MVESVAIVEAESDIMVAVESEVVVDSVLFDEQAAARVIIEKKKATLASVFMVISFLG